MSVLEVRGLCKRYAGFALEDVSFTLEKGTIAGFIGRNGAGKTTTLRSLLGLVHPDEGDIRFFGEDFRERELFCKQRLGFVSGGFRAYRQKRLKTIAQTVRAFYPRWNEEAYQGYLRRFSLDERKTPQELSEGMKVKFALALALSHGAELLILDEPTSGLDPISRSELLDIFLQLQREGVTLLFSTHITSDLDQCADRILYLRQGRLQADAPLEEFLRRWQLVELTPEELEKARGTELLGLRQGKRSYTALIRRGTEAPGRKSPADLETVMVHLEAEGEQ